jgi:hypothetical protein
MSSKWLYSPRFPTTNLYAPLVAPYCYTIHPTITAWPFLRFPMEERPPVRRVAVNILHKQLRTADKGLPPSLGFGRSTNNCPP